MRSLTSAWDKYRSAQLFGGESRFVLSTSGHIQALVNPPSPESRSSYRVVENPTEDSPTWFDRAAKAPGSWWPDYVEWLQQRSGERKPAPKKLGTGEGGRSRLPRGTTCMRHRAASQPYKRCGASTTAAGTLFAACR